MSMIIDKILAQGEYTVGDSSDSSYEYYTFDFDTTNGALIINLQPATDDKFPGNTPADKSRAQQEKRNEMMRKLQDELLGLFALPNGEPTQPYFGTDRYNRKLTIPSVSLNRLMKNVMERSNYPALLEFALNKIRTLVRLYFYDGPRREDLKNILENRTTGLVRIVPLANKYQFVIDDSIPNAELKIKNHFTQQLRTAVKFAVGNILGRDSQDPEFIEDDENNDSGDPLHAFNLSSADYQALCTRVGVEQVEPLKLVTDHDANGDAGKDIKQQTNNVREYSKEALTIINQLNESIFNQYRINPPLHEQKNQLIVTMRQLIYAHTLEINVLSDIYHFLNQPNNKFILNVHQNPKYDAVLFKTNTTSWQDAMEGLRNEAMKVLLQSVEAYHNFDEIIQGQAVINDPEQVKRKLQPFLTDQLFCEHRSNKHFRNLFHATTAVQNLRKLIKACDAQIEKQEKARRSRIMLTRLDD